MGTKLTKESLKQMIKEELGRVLNEEKRKVKRKVYKPEQGGPCGTPSDEPQCAGEYNNERYEVCVPEIGWNVKKYLEKRYASKVPRVGEIYLKKYCSYVRTSGKSSLDALKLARDETLKWVKEQVAN